MWVKTELIDCPLCGSKEFDEVAVRCDNLHIVKCKSCNLAFLNPRPTSDEIWKLYEKDYYSSQTCGETSFKGMPASAANVRNYKPYGFDMLKGLVSLNGKRALDIGCSYGKWVYWMSKYGARAVGIDLAQQCVEWGRQNLELDLRQKDLLSLDEPDESFDIITMIDLIEHVTDLDGFMENLARLVKPEGVVFVQTPNFESYYKWRQDWRFLYFSLEHILYFDTATLGKLFADYGFLPCKDTVVLHTIPADRDGFIRQQKGFKRKLASYLLGLPRCCDFIHRGLSRFLAKEQTYNYDSTRQQGAVIIGCYKKNRQ